MQDVDERFRAALGDRYRVEHELGRGGMAIVYRAEDLRHGRKVALKVLRPELAESIGIERFNREIRVAAQLNHPNILAVIDSGEAAGFLYYVTPFIEGASLRDRITAESQLPVPDAIRITTEVADALAYAHERGVVHRDIKPENILFQAGHALVSDFGIAAAVDSASGERLTQTGMAIGTPAYMSPEQASAEPRIDPRTDQYSLAAVTYEMLVGMPPHVGASAQATIARKLVDPVPGIRVVRDAVPAAAEAAVLRALAKSPADRFPTVRDFSVALTSDAAPTSLLPATVRRRRLRLAAAWSVGGVLVLVAAALAGRTLAGKPPPVESVAPLTSDPGAEWFPSMSPDGQWVAFSGEAAGRRQIFLLSIGGHNAIPLTHDSASDNDQPAFSPDGDRIAFRSSRDSGGIFVMGRTGESVRRLTPGGFRPTWAPGGREIAFVTDNVEFIPQNVGLRSQLWVVEVETGRTRQIPVADAVQPNWSPRGQRIAYAQRFTARGRAQLDIWTVPANGGDPAPVTNDGWTDWNPTWSPDGRYLYFVSDRGGSMNLWRVRVNEATGRARGVPEAVTTPATSLAHISFSADGKRLAYSSATGGINIQRARFDPVAGALLGPPEWITSGSRRWSSPDPSPDGRQIAFYDLDQSHIYVADADGRNQRQVTTDSAMDRVPRWSPDGRWLAFYSNRGGPLQIWSVRPDGSTLEQWTLSEGTLLSWSPDGSRIAATSNSADSGAYVFTVGRGVPVRHPERLPKADAAIASFAPNSWSPDGTRLVGFIGFGDVGTVVLDLRTRRYERLTRRGGWPVWLPDSRRVLFVSGGKSFHVVDVATRQQREIFSVDRDVLGPPRMTRDGRTIYFTRRSSEADIWLMTFK